MHPGIADSISEQLMGYVNIIKQTCLQLPIRVPDPVLVQSTL